MPSVFVAHGFPLHYLKSVTFIPQWWNLAHFYVTWKRSKIYMVHVTHPLRSAGISILSPELEGFVISGNIDKNCILLRFFWVFKGCIFNLIATDDISKIGYSSLLKIKVFWKKVMICNLRPWHHQANFVTLLKLNCRCGHATKVW